MIATTTTAASLDLDRAAAAIWAKRRARARTVNIRAARRMKSTAQFLAIAFA